MTVIISGFPGIGKTYFCERNKDALDLDSSNFTWFYDEEFNRKERRPDFPNNYIKSIRENIGKYKYILVSTHDEVRKALQDEGLPFVVVYPSIDRKDEFIQRYKDRGNNQFFIDIVSQNWETWINGIKNEKLIGFRRFEMREGNLSILIEMERFWRMI